MINQKFDYLYAENGRLKAVVVDKNGEPQVTDVTPDKPYSQSLITDGQGDTLVVSKKGQVMGVKEYKFAGDDRHLLNEYHRQLDSLGDWQINFNSAKEKQTYAFDQIGSGNHGIFATDEYYPKSGSYDFRYKSVECGKSDKVIVDFGSYPQADSVIFKDKYGVKLKVVDGNILSFTGVSQPDTNYIYAYRGDKKIGKLFLNTYQPKKYQVVFVKVNNGAPKLKEKEVKEVLNKVYNQCAVKFEISIEEFYLRDLTSFSHGGSGILTVYNDDQKKVLQAYETEKKMKDGVFYLFFIDNVTDKKDGSGTPVSGYMPRGYNAGFIYDGGSPYTIAHELGHGIGNLEHVFENSNNSGKTANLMDYANGEELWHFQWDQIQDPSRVWMKWNKAESEGENRLDNLFYFQEKCKNIYFIFSPYVSKKFELLLNSGGDVSQTLDKWATGSNFLDATQSMNIKTNIYKSTTWDSKNYCTIIDYFKSQYSDKTPIVRFENNPDGTDSQHIAVYCLMGQATNVTSLEDYNRSDLNIQEPYFVTRYEFNVGRPNVYNVHNTTEDDLIHLSFDYYENTNDESVLSWIFHKLGVFMVEVSLSAAKAGFLSAAGGQAEATYGLAFDTYSNVAIYGNLNVFCYAAGHGWHSESLWKDKQVIGLSDFEFGSNSSLIADAALLSGQQNHYWMFRMNTVRDVFGVGSTSSLSFSLGPLDLSASLGWDKDGHFWGIGRGIGVNVLSIPISFSHIMAVNRGLVLTWSQLYKLITSIKIEIRESNNFDWSVVIKNKKNFGLYMDDKNKLFIKLGDLEIHPDILIDRQGSNDFYLITTEANQEYKNRGL